MSTPTRFQRLERLYHRVMEATIGEREAVLSSARSEEPELYQTLVRLLDREAEGDEQQLEQELSVGHPIEVGSRIGPYRLRRQLGEGGMGVVFEAEQEAPVRRRVALKLVQSGLHSRGVLERFLAEQQVLARMSHPGIAQVYDAGATADGRPYFVMELVAGAPLTEYCDRHALGVQERLHLFRQVCAAVEHAHCRGVLHRDLKPSNILVTQQEGAALPKVIDFGIAKALTEDGSEPSRQTRVGEVIGTLEYMSPEQATGLPLDTRSDVYSLGVVLYELLVGRLPVEIGVGGSVPEAARRSILEGEPRRPSARLTPASAATSSVAERRSTDAPGLARALRGDLDWVTMKALDREPDRRYSSAAAFADDIDRHLGGRPVEAGPPATAYRLAKFAGRHRVGVTAAALLLLALVAGTVGTSIGLVRARRAEQEARTAEAEASREAASTRRVAEFLVDLFKSSDPTKARGEEITARELLDRGAERLATELDDEPLVRAQLLETVGEVYNGLGLSGEALGLLEESLELRRRQLGPQSEGVADSLFDLGVAHRHLGEYRQAEAAIREALAIRTRLGEEETTKVGVILNELGILLSRTERYGEAVEVLERALAITERRLGSETAQVASLLGNLALLRYRQGHYDEAIEGWTRTLAILETVEGEDHPHLAAVRNNLGGTERRRGHFTAALAHYERALEIDTKVHGPEHPLVGVTLHNLSYLLRRLGRSEEALGLSERAVEIHRQAFHPTHHQVSSSLNGLGEALLRVGDYDRAREVFTLALDGMSRNPEANDGFLPLESSRHLASIARWSSDPGRAERWCREALASPTAATYGKQAGELHMELAYALLATDPSAAEQELTSALAALETAGVNGGERSRLEASYWALRGDAERALALLGRALDAGFSDAWLLSDPDLEGVRSRPGFGELARQLRKRLGA